MQQDRQRRGIRREHDELRGTAVQRLGGFVGALLELPVVRRLLNEVEDVLGERFVGDGPSYLFSSSVVAFKHVFFFSSSYSRDLPAFCSPDMALGGVGGSLNG